MRPAAHVRAPLGTRPSLRRGTGAVLAAAVLLAGCASEDDWSSPHAPPARVGALGAGFVDPESPPPPEGTVVPRPGSWDGVRPAAGYRVVLLRDGEDAATRTLARAVTDWAGEVDASVKEVVVGPRQDPIPAITRAMALRPDLIVGVGEHLVDPLAVVTASHLAQQFLVLGAQVAEPTHNVTAVDWTGGGYRGEGLGLPDDHDPRSFTPERANRAVRAGVAAIVSGLTGIVVRIA